MEVNEAPFPSPCLAYTTAVGAMLLDEVSMVVDEVSFH